ncbi:hypothetical protein [uncultured Duncaniella sp.]|uniref:hypothetical protein n=1 Tax=uncultured Duncaniella sp. TaxID=2768039 RepID=UPI00272C5CE2|nr:hypothetical protein [uncultured Duncaniella sp.]
MATIQSLLTQAAVIRDATAEGENTALRVGSMFVSLIQAIVATLPSELLDASGISYSAGESNFLITFNAVSSDGSTSKKQIIIPAASQGNAGLLTPAKLKEVNDAVASVADCLTKVNQANTKATQAAADATTAISTANAAKTTAETAKTTAETAKKTADSALSTANAAAGKADSLAASVGTSIAPLNESGLVPSQYLPGYLDDVLEFSNVVSGVTAQQQSTIKSPDDVGCMVVYDSDNNRFLLAVFNNATLVEATALSDWSSLKKAPSKALLQDAVSTQADETLQKITLSDIWLLDQVTNRPSLVVGNFTYYNNWAEADAYTATADLYGRIPDAGKVYVDVSTNTTYRWAGSQLVVIGSDLALGHTSGTAFPGDEGAQLLADLEELAMSVDNNSTAINRAGQRVGILEFAGFYKDSPEQSLGVWFREVDREGRGYFWANEWPKGTIPDDYNTSFHGFSSARTDRLFRCANEIYRYENGKLEKLGGSSTGNIINVHEITGNWEYMNRGTAASLVPAELRTGGRKITFSAAAGSYQTWQYLGSTPGKWADEEYWKPEVQSVSFNGGTPKVPDREGNIDIEYHVDVDDALNAESSNPVSNKAVVGAINEVQATIPQSGTFDPVSRQLSVKDAGGNDIFNVTIPGGGGGGETNPTAIELTINSPMSDTLKEGYAYAIEFVWRHYNINSNVDTQYGGTAELIVNGSTVDRKNVIQGIDSFDVGPWLGVGTNSVRVRITADDGVISQSAYIKLNVVTLSLTSPYLISSVTPKGTAIPFRYVVNGSGTKTVHFSLDGSELPSESISTSGATSVKSINTSALAHGAHRLEVYAEREISAGQVLKSNVLAFDLMVYEADAARPIIAVEPPTSAIPQYSTIEIPYAVYYPGQQQAQVKISLGGRVIQTSTVDRVRSVFSYRAKEYGDLTFAFSVNNVTTNVTVHVDEAATQVSAETDALALYLSSSGRSNDADDAAVWEFTSEDGQHTAAQFSGCHFDTQSGWLRDAKGLTALHLEKGAQCYIPFMPFASDGKLTGKTIEVEFSVSNCYDTSATVISCLSGNVGFEIKAQEMYMTSALNKQVSSNFKQDERNRVGFVIEQIGGNRFMHIFLNGKHSGVVQYDTSDYFVQNPAVGIALGHPSCELNVYNIRVYDNALSFRQMVNNYIADMDDTNTMFAKLEANDILNEDGGEGDIDYDKAVQKIPCITFIGELPKFKGDKKKNTKIIYEDRLHPEFSFTLDQAQNDVQGTSSQYYPRKNWKWKALVNFIMSQTGQSVKKYALRGVDGLGNVVKQKAVKTFCLKADFAESSGTHNTGAANFFHEVLYNAGIITPMQAIDPTVRTTVYGFPILMFHQESESSPRKFIGKYNFNNDKSTHDTFGFQGIPGFNDGMVNRDDYLVYHGSLATLNADAAALAAADDDGDYLLYLIDNGADSMTNHLVEYNAEAGAWQDKGEMWRWSAYDLCWKKNDGSTCTRAEGILDKVAAGELVENNVECWEFLNNGHPMCLFHQSDYTSKVYGSDIPKWMDSNWLRSDDEGKYAPFWTGAFEPRYPDNDDNNREYAQGRLPQQLKRVTDWLYSLDLYNGSLTDAQKKAKGITFAGQVEGYFNKRMMLAYDILRELVVAADQGAKNMMWAIIDGIVYIIFYDNDTIWLINNEGRLSFHPYVEPHSQDSLGKFVFNGESSNLWNLIEQSPLQTEKYELFSTMVAQGGMTYERALLWFNTRQSDQWCETVYNADSKYKYIDSFGTASEDGSGATQNYLDIAQGSREEHRKWAMYERFQYMNAKYCTGTYRDSYVYLRANTAGESSVPSKVAVTVTAAQDWYYGFRFSGNAGYTSQFIKAGDSVTFTAPSGSNPNDTETYVHQADRISDLGDLSPLYPTTLQVAGAKMLKRLVVGNKTAGYRGKLATLTLGTHPLMTYINVCNIPTLQDTLDLTGCSALDEIEAQGSAIRGVNLPAGSTVSKMHLPESMVQIQFDRLPNLTNANLVIDGYDNVQTVAITDCSKLNAMAVVDAVTASTSCSLQYIRVTGVTLRGNGSELIRLINLGVHGVNNRNGKPEIVGTYQLTKLPVSNELEIIAAGINPDGFTVELVVEAFTDAMDEVTGENYTGAAEVDTVTLDNVIDHIRYYNGETAAEALARHEAENKSIHQLILE